MAVKEAIRAREAPPPPAPVRPASADVPHLLSVREMARLLAPIRTHLLVCALLSGAAAAAGLAPFVAIAEIARTLLDAPEPDDVRGSVWTWVAVAAAGAGLRLVLLGLSAHVGHNADATMLHHLRVRIARRLGVLPLGWFRAAGSGQVKKAMTGDLEAMHELFAHTLGSVTGAVAVLLVGGGYLLAIDWRLALITLAVPSLGLVSYRLALRSMTTHMGRLLAAETRLSTASVEYLDGIGVAKAFGGRDGRVLDRFDAALREHTAAYRAFIADNRLSAALNRLVGSEMMVLGVVMATGLAFVDAGSLTVADLVPFLAVGVGLPTSFGPLMRGSHGLRMARLAGGHIDDLLSREPLPEPATPKRPSGHRVELDHVSFSYDGVTEALTDVSAVCEPGTLTALVGPSGAGKTTLASLLPRFYDVSGGAIRIGGVDIRDMDAASLLASMSLVFQDVALLRDSVRENIRVGRPAASDDEVRQAAAAAQIDHVIERLPRGYDTVLEAGAGGLSGGERQRLTIARAILSAAPIVVLDEATAALDPDSEAAVQDALGALIAGKTVIVIAHRLHTIAGADQILVLDAGRVAERGTHAQLLARDGLYTRMWDAQQIGRRS